VKTLRIWLLVLLALLLPLRGAMAAAMLCQPQGGVQGGFGVVEHHGAGTAATLPDNVRHGHATHDHVEHGHGALTAQDPERAPAGPSTGHEGCNLCAVFCSLTPLASTPLGLWHPPAQASLNPAPSAAAASFVSDGEERPPRTL
jgi:hypothetical protein